MKKIIIVIFILITIITICFFLFFRIDSSKIEVYLDRCIDGDTASFLIHNKKEKVRFLGIDTPETIHPNGIVEEYGEEASDYTCHLLKEANHIYLEYDINSNRYDKYNRVLGWIFVDNHNISELLLSKGYAKVAYIYGDYKYIDRLCIIQKEAYLNKIGIWNQQDFYQNNDCNKKDYN